MEGDGKENSGGPSGGSSAPDDVRQQLLSRMVQSGLLNSVKAHLRARLYAELKAKDLNAALAPPHSPTLQQHVLNCLVCEYLLGQQYKYSLSVFLAESGTHKLPALSHADLLRLVGVAPGSKLHSLVLAHSAAADGSGGCGGCLAAGIVEALPHVEACVPTLSAACQTEEPPAAALAARLAAVEREFLQRSEAVERQSARLLEERVAECQRACEARYAEQLRAEVARMREAEVGAAREAEAVWHERLLAAERAALQRAHQDRLDKLRAQEEELLEQARKAQRTLDQMREEHMQRMRMEEERAWWEQEEVAQAAKAAEERRRAEQLHKQERLLAEQQREAEERLHTQLQAMQRELKRQEEDVSRQQAALDLEREQLRRSRAELEARTAAEVELLQRQLAAQADSHAEERLCLHQEVDRLCSQVQLLQSTAPSKQAPKETAIFVDASGRQQAELQHSLSNLQQQQAHLEQELEVGRARERLWRKSASTNERLLEKASRWHEECLQHMEELRLTLAAAVREVEGLQQQVQLAAGPAEGGASLAPALAAAVSDTQEWREATLSRLDAARDEEGRLRRELSKLHQRATANRLHAAQALQGLLAVYMRGGHQPALAMPAVVAFGDGQPVAQDQRGRAGEDLECEEPSTSPAAVQPQSAPPPPSQYTAAGVGQGRSQWGCNREEPRRAASGSSSSPGISPSSSSAASEEASEEASPRPASRTTSHILAAYRARQHAASQMASAVQAASASASPRCVPPHSDPLDREGGAAAVACPEEAQTAAPLGSTADGVDREQQGSANDVLGASRGAAGSQHCGGSLGSAPQGQELADDELPSPPPKGQDSQGNGMLGQPNPLSPAAGEEYSEDYYISGDITSEDSKF